MDKSNIMLIGLGPHSKRIYYPLFEELSNELKIKLAVAVDLEDKKEDIENYLREKKDKPKLIFVPKSQQTFDKLNSEIESRLNYAVKKENIKGVIIATEPLVHVMYVKWALSQKISILLDKPISTYANISTNMDLAKKIMKDYNELLLLYKDVIRKKPSISFSVMAQRRFLTSFNIIKKLINECFIKTNCPVTNVQTFHSDGQWRMPTEIVEQVYHPYMQGYGKCSHSGYHYFDIIPFLLESAVNDKKYYDNIEVFTKFIRPLDFLEQLTISDYRNIFGQEQFNKVNHYEEDDLKIRVKTFGEIDALNTICFKKGNKVLTTASINLCHNGVSTRDWVTAEGRDLYQGNGRVGHESHIIQQGPFQTIHFHSYKSKDNDLPPNIVGSKNHVEIFVFKNHKMIGGKPVEKISIEDILAIENYPHGMMGKAKTKAFIEFIQSIQGLISRENMTSEFKSHKPGAIITSAIYQSAVAEWNNDNPLINLPFELSPASSLPNYYKEPNLRQIF